MKNLSVNINRLTAAQLLAAFLILLTLFSCKKETTEQATVFNPVGYWEGNAYLYRTVVGN